MTMQMTKSDVRLKRIIARQERIDSGLKKTMGEVIEQGKDLCEQKGELNHGEWIPWVEENLPFGVKQAQNYMKVFGNRAELNTNPASHLKEAVQMLATPKPFPIEEIVPEGELVDGGTRMRANEIAGELDAEWEEVEEDADEVAVTRRKFDYGEMTDQARRLCTSTKSLSVRLFHFRTQCSQLSRSGKDSVGMSWAKADWDDLYVEVVKLNKLFRKD